MKQTGNLFRIWDIAILVVMCSAVAMFFCFHTYGEGSGYIEVSVNGEVVLKTSADGVYPVVVNGKRLLSVVKDGEKVRVEDSTCPLKICEKMGTVGPGGVIICVPNKVVVKFVHTNESVDVMTW